MIDPTLWTFVTATRADTRAGSTNGTPAMGEDGYSSIIITIVCTLLAFIFGIICGLIAYGCISALLKRKDQQQSTSLHIDSAHCNKGASNEASAVYDEVAHRYCETGIPNVQMELNENVAYGHVKV